MLIQEDTVRRLFNYVNDAVDRLMGYGLYDYQMALWSTAHHKRDFCIIYSEILTNHQEAALDTVIAFLGLEPFEWEKQTAGWTLQESVV